MERKRTILKNIEPPDFNTAPIEQMCTYFDDIDANVRYLYPDLSIYEQMKFIKSFIPEKVPAVANTVALASFYDEDPTVKAQGTKALFYLNLKSLLSSVDKHCREGDDPDDLLQAAAENTIAFFRNYKDKQGNRFSSLDQFSAYLNTAAKRGILKYRKSIREPEIPPPSMIQTEEEVFDEVFRQMNGSEFIDILNEVNLTAEERVILFYVHVTNDGVNRFQQASDKFKITTNTLRSIEAKAARKVRFYFINHKIAPDLG